MTESRGKARQHARLWCARWTEGKIVNLMNVMAMHTLYGFSFLGRRHVFSVQVLWQPSSSEVHVYRVLPTLATSAVPTE